MLTTSLADIGCHVDEETIGCLVMQKEKDFRAIHTPTEPHKPASCAGSGKSPMVATCRSNLAMFQAGHAQLLNLCLVAVRYEYWEARGLHFHLILGYVLTFPLEERRISVGQWAVKSDQAPGKSGRPTVHAFMALCLSETKNFS